jgi:hypothetical protein
MGDWGRNDHVLRFICRVMGLLGRFDEWLISFRVVFVESVVVIDGWSIQVFESVFDSFRSVKRSWGRCHGVSNESTSSIVEGEELRLSISCTKLVHSIDYFLGHWE